MNNMKTGDILLFRADDEDFISKVIAWGTDSVYSHVAVCVSPGMNLAIEAMAIKGIRARDIRKIRQKYDVFRIKDGSVCDLEKTVSFLVDKLGRSYDHIGVLWLAILKLLAKAKLLTRKVPNRFQIENDYFCSELCYEAFSAGDGLDIVPQIADSDITSPGDIAKSPLVQKV